MARRWWKEAVVYQVYPRSFMDGNGDGIGDLKGLLSKLDYLQELGVDVVWLSPVYKSPNDDNGYDISHYCEIMDEFGTMADWEAVLAGLRARGIKLIMDLVVNHTSDEHLWFRESRRSPDNPYRHWYIWRPGKPDGRPPNNWSSVFGGSAWAYDGATGEYYLHLFSRKQPDLNWDNPEVRESVYGIMQFWLDKGIDGFRMDVINFISKHPELPDAGDGELEWGGRYFVNGPRVHEYLQEMNRRVLSRYDLLTVGEMPGVSVDEAKLYTSPERGELDMVFQFEPMEIDSGPGGKWDVAPWSLPALRGILNKWQLGLEGCGWNSLYLCNHDQPRAVSRFGSDDPAYRAVSAKLLATLNHTLQGTPFIYQGEELGMTNAAFPGIDSYRDIETLNMYRERLASGWEAEVLLKAIHAKSRDNARTPMQWNGDANAGFTTGTPWIGVNPNYREINAQAAMADPDSVFHYYRRLIALRKRHPLLVYGRFSPLLEWHDRIYAYTRRHEDETWLIVLNFSGGETPIDPEWLPEPVRAALGSEGGWSWAIGNYESAGSGDDVVRRPSPDMNPRLLRPYEARVLRHRS
ncbi:alpha-glucosidase [Paenibacillus thermoaerophilus]|uniref:oligo-1,6-glucosidase n=1 Tax=Paenibacillus thermoaerophilus TaxID=1215385 RepID=A0ABW2V237_9BACL|nr:alpha-glucosidase [Paenibacillus thermoaerophilus]TMV17732.1 alpha-glucosidase [Paenibacillus thermoaerophilus]